MAFTCLSFLICACVVAIHCQVPPVCPLPPYLRANRAQKSDLYQIVHSSTGLVVEAPKEANKNVFLAKWDGNAAQYFEEIIQDDGYSLFINKGNNYALEMAYVLQNDVITWYAHGMSSQKWRPDGTLLKSAYWGRGYVLEAQSLEVGSNLKGALPIHGSPAQQFLLVRASDVALATSGQ